MMSEQVRGGAGSRRADKARQQVAAVCYRVGPRGVEFLLVRSRGGRWIFPKGGVEPGLTYAQSAAMEAYEEGGVHGRMEAAPFARYRHGTSNGDADRLRRAQRRAMPVVAHLCEVTHLEAPREAKRKPTWFSAEKAKRRLLEDRTREFGDELAAVVDRAVSRIRRLAGNGGSGARTNIVQKEALQEVHFEAFENLRAGGALNSRVLTRYVLVERRRALLPSGNTVERAEALRGNATRVLELGRGSPDGQGRLQLEDGSQAARSARRIASIETARGAQTAVSKSSRRRLG